MSFQVLLRGVGWGAEAALKSLQNTFDSVALFSDDPNVIKLLRAADIKVDDYHDEIDVVVCAGHKGIIGDSVLERVEHINVHYSLLPKYRGMHSVVWAILNGESEAGVTFHKMNAFIDDGDILAQYTSDCRTQTALQVINACHYHVEEHLGADLLAYLQGQKVLTPQDRDAATWVTKRNLQDCQIDFYKDSAYLQRFFRALVAPYPLPFFRHNADKYEILDADIKSRPYFAECGKIVNIDNEGVWVKLADGLICIKRVSKNGGASMDASTAGFKIGCKLNKND